MYHNYSKQLSMMKKTYFQLYLLIIPPSLGPLAFKSHCYYYVGLIRYSRGHRTRIYFFQSTKEVILIENNCFLLRNYSYRYNIINFVNELLQQGCADTTIKGEIYVLKLNVLISIYFLKHPSYMQSFFLFTTILQIQICSINIFNILPSQSTTQLLVVYSFSIPSIHNTLHKMSAQFICS